MADCRGVFRLPYPDDFSELPDLLQNCDDDVCVVGIFGSSNSTKAKVLPVNNIIGRTVFKGTDGACQESQQVNNTKCHIDCYHDKEENIVYLHLVSVYDVPVLIRLCHKIQHNMSHSECHQVWKTEENEFARALLYIFTVCHIVLVSQPICRFDLAMVQLFRALESTRQKLLPLLSDELSELPVSRDWQNAGRMCTPRLLFMCEQSHLNLEDRNADSMEMEPKGSNKGKPRKRTPVQKLQHNLEDQIYRILRKSRVLTNNISHCLFTLPANQPFVHVTSQSDTAPTPMEFLIAQITNSNNTRANLSNYRHRRQTTKMSSISALDDMPNYDENHIPANSLKSFLWDHIMLVHSHKGFEDNLSRSSTTPHFEVPNYTKWLEVSSRLYEFYLGTKDNVDDRKQLTHFNSLQSALDLDMRFSEARCGKVLPIASRTYQDNCSSHYTSIVHNTKLSQALHVYTQHARGPAYEKYAEQLQEECEIFWQNGRQLCEVVSLTGHHCTHKLHLLPDDIVDPEIDAILPRRPHTNNNHTPAACNCGRTVVQRDDPFELKVANYEFFRDLEGKCCGKLKRYMFKVFEPKRKDSKATMLAEVVIKETKKEAAESTIKIPEKKILVAEHTGSLPVAFSPALSLGQSGAGGTVEVLSHDASNMLPGNNSAGLLSMADQIAPESIRDKLLLSELDGMSHLQGMMCSTSPRGHLPMFPSWSLLCLGKGGVYSPLKGLDQAGFLRDSNFLVPWDIPVPKGSTLDGHAWPSPSESGGGRKGGKHRDKRAHKESGADSGLRAYIGNEYECPRGHRFICSAPDKIVKATERSGVKDTGTKLVTMDMPLYSPCACRSTKPPLGQLMRIFIVTPDTSLYIKLNPRVRPGPHPCPVFYPEPKGEGMTLPRHTMWVLRFPYVYVEESGPILPPTDNTPPPGAKLLKGVYITTLKAPET